MIYHPLVDIKLEYETSTDAGNRAVISQTCPYYGDFLSLSEPMQKQHVIQSFGLDKNHPTDKLIAFHLPVTTWKRIPV